MAITRQVRQKIFSLKQKGGDILILSVGRKVWDILRRDFENELLPLISLDQKKYTPSQNAKIIADQVLDLFNQGKFQNCFLFYAQFRNVLTQIPIEKQIIPIAPQIEEQKLDYEYEPDLEILGDKLAPRVLETHILTSLLENEASEQGARMTAMDNATRNAGEMIDKLRIKYNRTRQAQITKELIEIISGAEAL